MPQYLTKRRRRWYAVLEIPKDIRSHFDGKPRFLESLKTESLSEAGRRRFPLIAKWKAEIESVRTGSTRPLRDLLSIAEEWRDDYVRATGFEKEILDEVITEKTEEIAWRDTKKATAFRKVVRGESTLIRQHIEAWLSTQDNEQKTLDMKRTDASRFAERFELTHNVTRRDVQTWAHELQHEAGLRATTVRRIITSCRGYWSYLQRVGILEDDTDPFNNAVERRKKSKADIAALRKEFSEVELLTLLNGSAQKGDTKLTQLIWLGMWTGCRIEELCALKTTSVHTGYFEVKDAKSKAGHRTVPIHSRLSEAMNCLVESSSDGFVLSDLSKNKYGDRSNAVGKRFGRLKKGLGFGPDKVFHSIRRTVATQLDNASIPEQISADILGHEKQTMTYGLYSGGSNLARMREAIEALSFQECKTPEIVMMGNMPT